MIAVAATLVGCSCEPPYQAITQSRTDERQSVGLNRTAARPTAHLATTKAKPTVVTAKTEPSANRTLLPPPTSSTQLEPKAGIAAAGSTGQPTAGVASNSNSRTTQQQVAAAITVAKRGTVAALAAAGVLVAIVMVRPEIRSVSDLEGKDVAIDEEYSESRNDILAAFLSKGAHPSQVSTGHSTAIDRLLNGEVPAAVLALVSTDSAEGFPDIAGFKIFQVPILPRSPAGNRDTPKRSE